MTAVGRSCVPTIYIDPGYGKSTQGRCACALADGRGGLARAWFAHAAEFELGPARSHAVGRVVWELPQYQGARSEDAGHDTLIKLAAAGGELAGAYAGALGARIERVTPGEWKGSIPKPIHHSRMWDVLTPDERLLLGGLETERRIADAKRAGALARWAKSGAYYYGRAKGSEIHNLLDAVAMLCHDTGRLTKEGRQAHGSKNKAKSFAGKVRGREENPLNLFPRSVRQASPGRRAR